MISFKALAKQRGLTLLELMIAAAISLILMMFITNILLTSGRTAVQSEGLAQAQENGRFILSWLQTNIRNAGLAYPSDMSKGRIQPFADTCTTATLPPADNANCSFNDNNHQNSDRIAVRRTFVNDSLYKTDTSNTDCSGAEITTVADGEIVTDVYWVEPNNASVTGGVLKCATYSSQNKIIGSTQEIANGIDSIQVLYGVASGTDSQYRSMTNRYVAITDLAAPINWDLISSIRISILTRAFTENSLEKNKRSYVLLDADPLTYDDRVVRHIQTTTVFLPNE